MSLSHSILSVLSKIKLRQTGWPMGVENLCS